MKFSDFNISNNIVENLAKQGIEEPTEVQQKSIPIVFDGKDLLVESETGSGKTLAFSLPVMENLEGKNVQALVLSPTRELAKQIAKEVEKASDNTVESVTIYGGVSYEPQIEGAKKANIVIGTPGRVLDLLNKGHLDVSKLNYFVLDEADRMLDMGFQDELEQIIEYCPENRQNLLFGATIPHGLKRLCDKYNIDPEIIRIERKKHTRNLKEGYINCRRDNKLSTLYTFLKQRDRDLSIVFCQTKNTTRWLADKLRKNGFEAEELNGDMSQHQREKVVDKLKQKDIRVIVATDVAARGLHIDDISHVFNYDVPNKVDTYTHRIGRAGRQGEDGEAITLLEPDDHQKFRRLKKHKKIPRIDRDTIDFEEANM